ncbi:MAG: HNH endonuclease [Magnetococcales bacterium]|nr:HNH endonuclease [Magnetococcales bacterium]
MKLNISFPELQQLVRRMGAGLVRWQSTADNLEPIDIRQVLLKGKEIGIDEISVDADGLLTYQGEKVLLYIKNTRLAKETLQFEREKSPKLHFSDCRTLDHMRNVGRFDRYIVTTNTSGEMEMGYHNPKTGERGTIRTRLFVCRNCLYKTNYKKYRIKNSVGKTHIRDTYSIREFFESFTSDFKNKPTYTDVTVPRGGYSDNWDQISKRVRKQAGWKCAECGVVLSEQGYRNLLHVHHVDGVTRNNSRSNLRVLCALCHKKEPQHGHLRVTPDDRAKISYMRVR